MVAFSELKVSVKQNPKAPLLFKEGLGVVNFFRLNHYHFSNFYASN